MSIEKIKSQPHLLYYQYNTKLKTYADGSTQLKIYKYDLQKGIVYNTKCTKTKTEEERKKEVEHRKHKALIETKQKIIDLSYENSLNSPWEYFATFTFDDDEVFPENKGMPKKKKKIANLTEYDRVVECMTKWINNMKHQNPQMSYIIAPELHPTSGRIHFHGIFKNVPKWVLKEAIDPNTNKCIYKNGKKIYNLTNYTLGYTTISRVGNQEAVSVYISKYITKEFIDLRNKKRFWASKNLNKPRIEYAMLTPDEEAFYILISNEVKDAWQGNTSKQYWLT